MTALAAKIPSAKVGSCLADLLPEAPSQQQVAEVLAEIATEAARQDLRSAHARKAAAVSAAIEKGTLTVAAQLDAAYGAG
jgi:hypothetical protein